MIYVFMFYILCLVTRCFVFQKLNIAAWKSMIPFYGSYSLLKTLQKTNIFYIYSGSFFICVLCWFMKMDWIGAILFIGCGIVFVCYWLTICYYVCKACKKNVFFYLLLVFLQPLAFILMGCKKEKE
ncbi:hypothetical protein [Floccifex sp.]|uniref:hypothetical protein n=1 Tax=Floccifex sp. TaxID=2815810 RepID=UPI003F092D03